MKAAARLCLPVIQNEHRARRPHAVRAISFSRRERVAELVAYPADAPKRPVTRADCYRSPRPCPFVGCRHNLYIDVTARGTVRLNFPDEPTKVRPSCSLDAADLGTLPLEYIGYMMNLTREAVRLIEVRALAKFALNSDVLKEAI